MIGLTRSMIEGNGWITCRAVIVGARRPLPMWYTQTCLVGGGFY